MSKKITLSLYDMAGVAVIIQLNTGVIYTNQACGTACLQPCIEGALLPVNHDFEPDKCEGMLEVKLAFLFKNCEKLSLTMADKVDELLRYHNSTDGIKVDRNKLQDSYESWIYVKLKRTKYCGFEGAEHFYGVLTWPNSD